MCNAKGADVYWGGFLVNKIFSLGDIGYIQLSLDNTTSQDEMMCFDYRPSPIPSLRETLLSMVSKISSLSNSQLSISNFTSILLFNCQNASLVNHDKMCNRYLSLSCNNVQTSCIEFELSKVFSNLSIISKCQHSEMVIKDHGLMDKSKIGVGMVEFQWQMGGFKNIEVNCEMTNIEDQHRSSKKSLNVKAIVGIVVPIGVIAVLAAAFYICRQWPNVLRISMSNSESGVQLPSFVSEQPEEIAYEVLNRATGSFRSELGNGTHGRVFKGIMQDGTQIAVKVLDGISAHIEKEFKTEMATLSSISHINVVRLIGFCIEKARRFIVYELVENGSLDKWIFHNRVLKWPQRYAIAMDVARGLAYLHEECRHEIVHCDIKPQNILVDGKFNAKIADFGIAKLIARTENGLIETGAKGTCGYIAPEFSTRGNFSNKLDVYSYGMVLLEIISGRKNYAEQVSFPHEACIASKSGQFESLLDKRLSGEEDCTVEIIDQVGRATLVALSCIQKSPEKRPTMKEVLQMLEGSLEVPQNPPKPPLCDYLESEQENSQATSQGEIHEEHSFVSDLSGR